MSNRRLIAMIRGRATAGDPSGLRSLAARPQVVSALSRWTRVVGGAGVVVVLVASFGGGLISSAADAAVTGGAGFGSGHGHIDVAGMAASAPVPVPVQSLGRAAATPVAPPAPVVAPATPARVTAPAPHVVLIAAAPVVTPSPGSVEAIILEVFGAHGQEAIRVANCESRLHPGSVSRNGENWGLFQINTAHRQRVAAMGYRWEDLLDARVNALVAKAIFDEQGWAPWGCRGAAA